MKNFFIRQSRNISYILTGFLATLLAYKMPLFLTSSKIFDGFLNSYRQAIIYNFIFIIPLLLTFLFRYLFKKRRTLEIFELIFIIISFALYSIFLTQFQSRYTFNIFDNILIHLTMLCLLFVKFTNIIFMCNISNEVINNDDNYLKKKNKKTNSILIILAILFICFHSISLMLELNLTGSCIIYERNIYNLLVIITIGAMVVINLLPERVKINTIVLAGYIVVSSVLSLFSFEYDSVFAAIKNNSYFGAIDSLVSMILIVIIEISLILNNLDLMKKYCAIIDEVDENEKISEVKSTFDGKLIQLIGWKLLGLLLAIITLGIAYPATLCFIERWKCKHSIVSGKRLTFDGKGIQLFGKWCLWLLLCVVTFGVYAWFIPIRIEKWKTHHTHFEDEPLETRNSNFDGNLLQLIGLNLLSIFVVVITFGLAYPSTLCWKEKWLWKHKEIDGSRFVYDGKGIQLIGKWMCYFTLSLLTFYIFAWFIPIKIYKWKLSHTHLIVKDIAVAESEEL